MRRAVFYIDGYNLYCGLKETGLYSYIWLNVEWLCRRLVERGSERLLAIKYFSALPEHDPAKAYRHRTFLAALQAVAHSVEVILGEFKETSVRCKVCGGEFRRWEEKRTDVAIALHLLADSHTDMYDTAYIISADSDLVPAIRMIHDRFPSKRVRVWFPPGRHSNDIKKSVDFACTIPDRLIRRCQLPDPIGLADGTLIRKPSKWK